MRNINGLIIPAESEIKGNAFYCSFLTDGGLILHHQSTDRSSFANPDIKSSPRSLHVDVTVGGIDCHNTSLGSKLNEAATALNALDNTCHMGFVFKMHHLN